MTQERNVVGAIRPGRYLTRGGQEVYVACRCNHNPDGTKSAYPWWVEDGRRGWSVDEAGRHLKNGASQFDIVSRVDAGPAVNEPKVTDPPEAIWLVYGDLERDDTHRECCASGEVTWCEDAQFAADVRYVRAATAEAKILALELALSELRHDAMRTLVAWDGTVLPKAHDGLMQERMECLRAALAGLGA